ncbi:MAG TPA: SusC/RagA family TonB-linked outer membrane protein [Gemmatimonadaceae bacterium]|nr:SusC/RagA family TonB-linked outer membrane protein [Gemmatimonadaceae bacterium]
MIRRFCLQLVLPLLAGSAGLGAQQVPATGQGGTIVGTVKDRATQSAVSSAQVSIVGTTRGGLTNDQGSYRITGVPAGSYQVRVLRIGYQASVLPVTVTAGQSVTLDVTLGATVVTLDQVTVTATGEQIRQRETGASVATIAPAVEELAATSNFTDVLNSRAPGLYVQQSNGAAGTGSRIRVRGANSLSLSNEPLLIVDGVRVNNDVGNREQAAVSSANTLGTNLATGGQTVSRLNDINPEDIETIDVIRGPSGVALYGTAAANGVIQITTKRGRAGQTRWTSHFEGGQATNETDFPDNVAMRGRDNAGNTVQCNIDSRTRGICTADQMVSRNPLTTLNPFRNGARKAGGINASGGTDRYSFFVGADYDGETGVLPTSFARKAALRGNLRTQLRSNWDLSFNNSFVRDNTQLPISDNSTLGYLGVGLLGRPLQSDTLNGGWFNRIGPEQINYLAVGVRANRYSNSINTNFQALPWLSFAGVAGLDYVNQLTKQVIPPNRVFVSDYPQGSVDSNPWNIYNWTTQATATATFTPFTDIRSSTQFGGQYAQETFQGTSARGAVLTPGSSSLSGTSARFRVAEYNTDNVLLGVFGQQQLSWRDRVFVNAGLRGDRNSAFGQRFGWVYYPTVNASWVASEEGFFPQNPIVSSLRLRAAYGQSGRQPNFRDAITYLNPTAVRVDNAELPAVTFTQAGVGDPTLKPERTAEQEFGFDAGVWQDRLNLQVTYYAKTTRDLLVQRPLAVSIGGSDTRFENIGRMQNRGWEGQLSGTVVKTDPITFELTVGGSLNDNKLVNLGAGIAPIPLNSARQQHRSGYPAGGWWQRPYTYADANNDGMIARSEVHLADTAMYLGNPLPKREFQAQPAITLFKNVRLQALVSHRGGYKTLNNTDRFRCAFAQNCRAINDPTSPLADQAAAIAALLTTDAGYIQDASFTRLREVSVTLAAPKRWAGMAKAETMSLTLAGRNIATWTDYKGLDPEVTSTPNQNFSTSDFLTLPPVRYLTARINLAF